MPELQVVPTLLGKADLSGLTVTTRIQADHPDEEARADGYWAAYIVKGHKTTRARVSIEISGGASLDQVDTLWADVQWINYGPFGRLARRQGVPVPLRCPEPLRVDQAAWQSGERCSVLPLKTHPLGPLDDPIDVRRYAAPLLQPGDVLTIGETPLAVIQGRYHPSELELARCKVGLLFSSHQQPGNGLGHANLIDVGTHPGDCSPLRPADETGGIPWLYRLAGDQARLIDDITGTTPPTTKQSCWDRNVRRRSALRPRRPLALMSPSSTSRPRPGQGASSGAAMTHC